MASVCPYCAVGCGQIVSVRDGQIVNIEGNPDSPINRGTLCPKGSATFQLAVNPEPADEGQVPRPARDRLGGEAPRLGDGPDRPLRQADARRHLRETWDDAGRRDGKPDQEAVNHCAHDRLARRGHAWTTSGTTSSSSSGGRSG